MAKLIKSKLRKTLYYLSWLITGSLALCLVYRAFSYFNFDLNYHFLKSKADMLSNEVWLVAFYTHLLFGGTAILSGLPLFFSKLIPHKSKWHRTLGKTYIYSILFFSGPTGFYLAFFAEGGKYATIGFICMCLVWMFPTYKAMTHAIAGNIEAHQKWIIRSFALTLSGVTLRIVTPLGARYFGLDEQTNFVMTAYFPWIFNWAIAEIILIRFKKSIHTNPLNKLQNA